MKVAICVIAKQENNYIKEWVDYYYNLGVDHIFLYDNNDIDGENFDVVLSDYIESQFVSVIDYRGLRTTEKYRVQFYAYNNCYYMHNKDYDWIGFFDVDEFIHLEEQFNNNIKLFLSQSIFEKFQCVKLCWKVFGDNELLDVTDNNYHVQSRFTTPSKAIFNNGQTKPFYRGALPIKLGFTSCHGMHNDNIPTCNAIGMECPNNSIYITPPLNCSEIFHYQTKTLGEYIRQKMVRGDAAQLKNPNCLNFFFGYNTLTQEKLDYAKKLLN